MKTLRITAALLAILAAAACESSPTGSFLELDDASAKMDGTGYMGGGTK